MDDNWYLAASDKTLTGEQAAKLIQQRVAQGLLETWLECRAGPTLGVMTNGDRVMIVLLAEPDDPGVHAVDPSAVGQQDGYVLSNGQHDTYANRDTVSFDQALRAVQHIVEHGGFPDDVAWQCD